MDMNNNVKKHMDTLLNRYPDLQDSAEKIHTLYFNLENVFSRTKRYLSAEMAEVVLTQNILLPSLEKDS